MTEHAESPQVAEPGYDNPIEPDYNDPLGNGPGLYFLSRVPADYSKPIIDIVAVHGLNGNCIETWTHRTDKGSKKSAKVSTSSSDRDIIWLRDLLPEKIPNSRVMTFQYDSKIWRNKSKASISDTAKQLLECLKNTRPVRDSGLDPDIRVPGRSVVFVAHSLGGIVVKQALQMASADGDAGLNDIAADTKGIVFFGTPHRGSDIAKTLGSIHKMTTSLSFGWMVESKFVGMLTTHSDDLLEVSADFLHCANRYALISFYEQHIHPRLRKLVVDKMSSVMGMAHEETVMLGGDHSGMCKFWRGDPRFETVWRRVLVASNGHQTARRGHMQRSAAPAGAR